MCRHIGYIGIKKSLDDILLNHNHSLIELSYKPKEMHEAILNADGFGIGWKNKKDFYIYKNSLPIWNDLNLKPLSRSIYSSLVIGNVRSSTIIENIGYFNTHPFSYKNYCFSHNGFITGFNFATKNKIIELLNNKFLSLHKGNTDSEVIFLLLMQYIEETKNIKNSIKKVIAMIEEKYNSAALNFLLAFIDNKGKETLYATKYSKEEKAPSLYFNESKTKNFIISSEKLNNQKWIGIEKNSYVEINNKEIKIDKI